MRDVEQCAQGAELACADGRDVSRMQLADGRVELLEQQQTVRGELGPHQASVGPLAEPAHEPPLRADRPGA